MGERVEGRWRRGGRVGERGGGWKRGERDGGRMVGKEEREDGGGERKDGGGEREHGEDREGVEGSKENDRR